MVEFAEGLKYPWGKPIRLLNILWILIPILGLFAVYGYIVEIVTAIVKGNKKEFPEFKFWDNLSLGFLTFIKYIPLMVVLFIISWILGKIPVVGNLVYYAIALFIVPYLVINLFVKRTVGASFAVDKAWDAMSKNFKEYVIALVYTILYTIIYIVLSVVLVGIPCLMGTNIYLAEFYAKHKP